MTNNDELALKSRETFEHWWQVYYHNGNPPRLGWQAWREGDGYKTDEDDSELNDLWNSWQAAQSSLLAERDADKKRIAELEREKETMTAAALAMRDDMRDARSLLEARTVSVKLPESVIDAICLTAAEIHNLGRGVSDERAQDIIDSIRCAAGIKLEVGE